MDDVETSEMSDKLFRRVDGRENLLLRLGARDGAVFCLDIVPDIWLLPWTESIPLLFVLMISVSRDFRDFVRIIQRCGCCACGAGLSAVKSRRVESLMVSLQVVS